MIGREGREGTRGEDVAAVGGFVIVYRLLLFCGRGEELVEEEANERRDGKLVTGGGKGEEEDTAADGKTRRETSVSDGSTETARLSGRYKN